MASSAEDYSAEDEGAGATPSAQALSSVETEGKRDLEALRIDRDEVERLCGLEVHGLWVGSLWTGAYRLGVLKRSPFSLVMTELP